MNNEEQNTPRNHGPRRGPGAGAAEKPKDLKKAVDKLFQHLKPWISLIIISFVLAATASVFSIIGPNKISDLTNKISEGLVIDRDKFSEINADIMSTLTTDNMQTVSRNILNMKLDNSTMQSIMMSTSITNEDKVAFKNALANLDKTDESSLFSFLTQLPDSIATIILPDSTYDGIVVTTSDKLAYIKAFATLSQDTDQSTMLNTFVSLPKSIQSILLPESTIDDVVISTEDKVSYLEALGNITSTSNNTDIYAAIDQMPDNIKELIQPTMDMNGIYEIVRFLAIIYIISGLFNFLQSFIMADVSNNFAKNLRQRLSIKMNKLPLKYFDSHSLGNILSIITNDVDTIASALYQSLGGLIGEIALVIGSVIMMFYTNSIMAISAILSCVVGLVMMLIILLKSQKYFSQRQEQLGKLNGHIEEVYSSLNVVKAYNGEEEAGQKFNTYNNGVREADFKSQFLSGMMPSIMNFTSNFSYFVVCVVGATLVMNKTIEFGTIVAFIIYVRLFTNPLSQIAQGLTQLQSATAASERVFDFLEEEEMPVEVQEIKVNKHDVKGNIEFDHVKFGYDKNKTIIKDFTCHVKPGQKVAIVGPTGAGKTTLVNLLMKFYDIDGGDIQIDGISTKKLTRENIHALFIMVLQDTWLFNGTIRDNIKYNKDHATDEQIWDSLKVVGADHFVKSLPHELDYQITDSESISAGQKQLLTIARGMVKNAPFLILDEATSSVDTRTEELVQKAMDKLTEGRTSFIIAHRLSTIRNADMILVLEHGDIIETGTHEELLKKHGVYADLYESQFQK